MAMKCDSCIHKQICKDKPPESYPQFMIDIMTDKCENYIHTAYVQPVRRGRWLTWDDSGFTKCSCCNSEYYIADLQEVGDSEGFVEFCPNCGAKMDGDRDD